MRSDAQRDLLPAKPINRLASLRELSARLGADPLLTQGTNGNTSIKLGNMLWIKASGKNLAHATQEEIFVPVDLETARAAVDADADDAYPRASIDGVAPSRETPLHAVLRHQVVLHVHSVNCIAWAVRLDAPAQFSKRLQGLHWQWLPYIASGVPVAREVKRRVAEAPETDVWILGNHGLVICGKNCEAAEELLEEVERRLATAPRMTSSLETTLLALSALSSGWRWPGPGMLHALGADPASCERLKAGCLYPSQAIFLGSNLRTVPRSVPLSRFADHANGREGGPTFAIIEGGGVLFHERINSAEETTLLGLAQVLQRIEECTPLRYLTPREIGDLAST